MTHPTSRANTEDSVNLGVVGIVQITLPVPISTSIPIANFYSEVFGFDTQLSTNPERATIIGGPSPNVQRIVFEETAGVGEYNGDHFCFYMHDFENVFERCRELDILYVNARFTHLDDSRTLE